MLKINQESKKGQKWIKISRREKEVITLGIKSASEISNDENQLECLETKGMNVKFGKKGSEKNENNGWPRRDFLEQFYEAEI